MEGSAGQQMGQCDSVSVYLWAGGTELKNIFSHIDLKPYQYVVPKHFPVKNHSSWL